MIGALRKTGRSAVRLAVRSGIRKAKAYAESVLIPRSNEDLAISAALAESHVISELNYPASYVDFLRQCIQRQHHVVKHLKSEAGSGEAAKRFATLLDVLRTDVPAVPLAIAHDIGRVADGFRSMAETKAFADWIGDVGLHFAISSSFGRKGRLLSTIIRYMRAERCLEVGTAYGMSALFMLSVLAAKGRSGHLTTVEGGRDQFELASTMLKERYGENVSCRFGSSSDELRSLADTPQAIDFFFHDAGHSREMYLKDFGAALPMLAPGSTILIDDIYWDDPRFYKTPPRAHDGWLEIVGHSRVLQAVEVDHAVGLALLA